MIVIEIAGLALLSLVVALGVCALAVLVAAWLEIKGRGL